jgi:peptidoglycan/LPS O-acetylase OafA/YrhL
VTERFRSLDVFRGLAALSVTLFHCVGSHPAVHESAIGRVLLFGWTGVFLFFPVSGYCIFAALHRAENGSVLRFMRRRWRRIYPPYWASIGVTVAIALVALPFNRGTIADLVLPPWGWLSVLTLTQVFTPWANALSPVYWTLGYEEQFYAVMALALLVSAARRVAMLTALTVVAGVYELTPAFHVTGLFLNYWVSFALGCAAYIWLHRRDSRWMATIIFAVGAVLMVRLADVPMLVSLVGTVLMLALAPMDQRVAAHPLSRPLLALGMISYSLYLIHVPIAGRVVNFLVRFDTPVWLAALAGLVASLAGATLFFVLVERRSLPQRSQSAPAVVPSAV